MARNPEPRLKNRSTLYLATSGGGKSQALGQNPAIPKSKARVILWDKAHDHRAHHYDRKGEFIAALKRALASGRGFRLAYSGGHSVACYEWFCQVVWAVLDGRHRTYVVVEELSEVCEHAGKATPMAARLLNQGRKYGLVFHGTSQKPQEISKTYYTECPVLWVGRQRGDNVRKMARDLGVTPEQVAALEPMQFLVLDEELHGRDPVPAQLTYKKIN